MLQVQVYLSEPLRGECNLRKEALHQECSASVSSTK
jgi:hypothetical protein